MSPVSFDFLPFAPDNVRRALNEGTTLTMRMFLALCALAQGGAHLFGAPTFLNSPAFQAMNSVIPVHWWGWAFMAIGILGTWRVCSWTSRPLWAWGVNIATMLVWSIGLIARLQLGPMSLLSIYTVVVLAAFWCLLRTEATERDTRTA